MAIDRHNVEAEASAIYKARTTLSEITFLFDRLQMETSEAFGLDVEEQLEALERSAAAMRDTLDAYFTILSEKLNEPPRASGSGG